MTRVWLVALKRHFNPLPLIFQFSGFSSKFSIQESVNHLFPAHYLSVALQQNPPIQIPFSSIASARQRLIYKRVYQYSQQMSEMNIQCFFFCFPYKTSWGHLVEVILGIFAFSKSQDSYSSQQLFFVNEGRIKTLKGHKALLAHSELLFFMEKLHYKYKFTIAEIVIEIIWISTIPFIQLYGVHCKQSLQPKQLLKLLYKGLQQEFQVCKKNEGCSSRCVLMLLWLNTNTKPVFWSL